MTHKFTECFQWYTWFLSLNISAFEKIICIFIITSSFTITGHRTLLDIFYFLNLRRKLPRLPLSICFCHLSCFRLLLDRFDERCCRQFWCQRELIGGDLCNLAFLVLDPVRYGL